MYRIAWQHPTNKSLDSDLLPAFHVDTLPSDSVSCQCSHGKHNNGGPSRLRTRKEGGKTSNSQLSDTHLFSLRNVRYPPHILLFADTVPCVLPHLTHFSFPDPPSFVRGSDMFKSRHFILQFVAPLPLSIHCKNRK